MCSSSSSEEPSSMYVNKATAGVWDAYMGKHQRLRRGSNNNSRYGAYMGKHQRLRRGSNNSGLSGTPV